MDEIGKQDNNLFIGSVMDRKSGGQRSVSKIEFQKKRNNGRSDKRAGTRKGKQIDCGRIN